MSESWDRTCLGNAYQMARQSLDPSTQNGAWLLPDGYGPSTGVGGFNHIPAHLLEPGETMANISRDKKIACVLHAEKAAIFKAGQFGHRTNGATLYCLWYACPDCANTIIAAGIKRVVGHRPLFDMTPERWHAEVQEGLRRLEKAGVDCDFIAGPIGRNNKIRFDGKIFDASEVFVTLPEPDRFGAYKFEDGSSIYPSTFCAWKFSASAKHTPLHAPDGTIEIFDDAMAAAKALAAQGYGPGAPQKSAA